MFKFVGLLSVMKYWFDAADTGVIPNRGNTLVRMKKFRAKNNKSMAVWELIMEMCVVVVVFFFNL
jgi:hypothetical protein